MKVLIVGGVAGGASCAARLRRNNEQADIVLFERGDYISFANCGLPYYIGGIIGEKNKLTLQTPESFYNRFRVDVRTGNEVVKINRQQKTVSVKKADGSVYEESYDKLVLSPGAEPIRPPLPGFDGKKVFSLRNIPDTFKIKDFCDKEKPKKAVVIGGGYIGVEIAENLARLGIEITIVELGSHVIPPVDSDTAAMIHNHLRAKGVGLRLSTGVNEIKEAGGGLAFTLSSGDTIEADFAILAAGVKPESGLAKDAGLETGLRGAIVVDNTMKTSDENIYAVGDAVQVTEIVGKNPAFIPLASPANKQGRIAADNICGGNVFYGGSQGSSVLKVFDLTVAATGLSESALLAAKIPYKKSYTYSPSNASYYPGGLPMSLKLLFAPESGRILGAQAVGFSGVDKRIDVIASAIRFSGTVFDLTNLELCYAPPFSSAKDPVNMAGYTAENILKGLVTPFYPEDVENIDTKKAVLLDVRTKEEFEAGSIPGAVNIPLDNLRERLNELSTESEIDVFCQIGLRGYIAARILLQKGFKNVRNLSGGYRLFAEIRNDKKGEGPQRSGTTVVTETQLPHKEKEPSKATAQKPVREIEVDACGLSCPGPIMAVHKAMQGASDGDVFRVKATDPAFASDIKAFCDRTGNKLLNSDFDGKSFSVTIEKGKEEQEVNKGKSGGNDKSLIVFSGDLDKAIAAFIIANGAASMGRKVHMFFTFWGLNILRKPEKSGGKDLMGAMFGRMMPRGSTKLGLSKLNMGGLGAKMIRGVMKNKNISSLEDLIEKAMENGVEITACSMSMDVMGIRREELIDGIKTGGVATFLASAESSDASLFI